MNNMKDLDLYDVGERYFGLSVNNKKLAHINCEDMYCPLKNQVISREEALELIRKKYDFYDGEWYISKKILIDKNIKDYINQPIFNGVEDLSGWLIQWDKVPFANWSHECEYFFVYGKDQFMHKEARTALLLSIDMERI